MDPFQKGLGVQESNGESQVLSCPRWRGRGEEWGGGGEGGNFLYMALYGCACRMASFFSAARYMISPLFFNKKYMTDPIFLIRIGKASLF